MAESDTSPCVFHTASVSMAESDTSPCVFHTAIASPWRSPEILPVFFTPESSWRSPKILPVSLICYHRLSGGVRQFSPCLSRIKCVHDRVRKVFYSRLSLYLLLCVPLSQSLHSCWSPKGFSSKAWRLVSWCFEPSQLLRITSGLKTNFSSSLI